MTARWRRIAVFALIVGVGLLLRVHALFHSPFWVDEAESAINGLTILEHGVPTDRYLDLPIFENVLVEPWDSSIAGDGALEAAEYEFRDVSYSREGTAVYHGWLPLYAIAAALWLADIAPAVRTPAPEVQHAPPELLGRIVAPRVPAVVFSIAFVVLMFWAGRRLGGPTVGWVALLVASLAQRCVHFGVQARYYSLTMLLGTVAVTLVWIILRRGRWRDDLTFAATAILLFHTHVLSSFVACCVFALAHALRWKRGAALGASVARVAATAAIVAAGTLPWAIANDFFGATAEVPRVTSVVRFPEDLWNYVSPRLDSAALFVLGFVLVAVAHRARGPIARHLQRGIGARREAMLYLGAWAVITYVGFCTLIPAASYFPLRLSLVLAPPLVLLASCILAGLAEVFTHSRKPRYALGITLVFLVFTDRIFVPDLNARTAVEDLLPVAEYAQEQDWDADARLYASPNDHLRFQYLLGLPVQSIAPIRASFLTQYPGRVVYFAKCTYGVAPDSKKATESSGERLDPGFAEEPGTIEAIWVEPFREELAAQSRGLVPDTPLTAEHAAAVERQRRLMESGRRAIELDAAKIPVLRGRSIRTVEDWWTSFFYRFVDPESRRGDRLNFHSRFPRARVTLLPPAFVVYDSPSPVSRPTPPEEEK